MRFYLRQRFYENYVFVLLTRYLDFWKKVNNGTKIYNTFEKQSTRTKSAQGQRTSDKV